MNITAVAIVVADKSGMLMPGCVAQLVSPSLPNGSLVCITNSDAYAIFRELPVPFTGTLLMTGVCAFYQEAVTVPNKQNITIRVGPTASSPQDVHLPPASFRKPVVVGPAIHGRLRAVEPRFHDDNGPYKLKPVTSFDAQRLATLDEWNVLKAYADWTKQVGGNAWRVFLNWKVTGLDFRTAPDYFGALRRLSEFTRVQSIRLMGTAICDQIPEGLAAQQSFLDSAFRILNAYDHTLGECANEPYNGNSELPTRFKRTQAWGNMLVARGMCRPDADPTSGDPNDAPYTPSLGYTTYQNPRSEDWYRKVGKDGYEIRTGYTHDACINNETMGAAETYQFGRRSNRPLEFFTAGVAAGMFEGSVTGHGDSLTMQRCVVPGPIEAECIRQLFRGVDLVPVDAPTWRYARYGPAAPGVPMPCEPDPIDGDGDQVRMHAMVGPTRAATVNYRWLLPGHEAWKPRGINGWHTVLQDGPYVLSER